MTRPCGQVHLDREQPIAILKELVAMDLVEPSFVHISERITNHYQIQIKSNYNREKIEEHAKKTRLNHKRG
jgi:hypothetical protein